MKQVLQDLKNGKTLIEEVPCPQVSPGCVLVKTHHSLISAGTERMLVEFGKQGWLSKAKSQPEKVRQVLDKIKTDGLFPTITAVKDKLDQALPMGYCNVGEIVQVGDGVNAFQVGDRVISNGHHAEYVSVPVNLCAKVPANVADEAAVFTVIASIALQSVRLLAPTLGENVVVMGLGLVGLFVVQLLRAQGCNVLASDFQSDRIALAEALGAKTVNLSEGDNLLNQATVFSRQQGVDGVIIATSTKDNTPIEQAAKISRKRGRIVLVGVSGLELSRDLFYHKELSFQVSCSYGPGRYDKSYEQKGHDYPLPYVRWTEQRNFQAILQLLSDNKLTTDAFISHRFSITEAAKAYEMLMARNTTSLGILLDYAGSNAVTNRTVEVGQPVIRIMQQEPDIGVIGAGNHAVRQILPALKKSTVRLKTIVSSTGISATRAAKKFGFYQSSTDVNALLSDSSIDAVIIGTRHDSHADLVQRALTAGKHVFVEKPLAITSGQLAAIEKTYQALPKKPVLMTGFNRRFAPHIIKMKSLLNKVNVSKAFVITVNAGVIPANHWVHDAKQGGGRIIGELCHFVDLLQFLASSSIVNHQATFLRTSPMLSDNLTLTLSFQDGSMGTIHYLSNGYSGFPKERVEVFANGGVLQLDNFRVLRGFGWPGFKKMKLVRQDKGHREAINAFIHAVQTGKLPISFEEQLATTRLLCGLMST